MAASQLVRVGHVIRRQWRAVMECRLDQAAGDRQSVRGNVARFRGQIGHGGQRVVISIQPVVDQLRRELGARTRGAEA
jgi:hypothetical protein